MIDESGFRAWLEMAGAKANAINTRTYAVRTIERKLLELGMPFRDLDEAWNADRFASLSDRLKSIRTEAKHGGEDFRILMPHSDKPDNRLSSWVQWLGQYGRFLSGETPRSADTSSTDADRIRQHVLEEYIEPAREESRDTVDVLVRDVNAALGLNEAWPNICQALAGPIFQEFARVQPPERIGADQSSATIFRFLTEETVPEPEISGARPFTLFDVNGQPYQPVKNFNRATGLSAYYVKPRGASNKADDAEKTEDIKEVARAMLINGLASRIKAISGGPVNYLTYGGDKLVRYELDPDIAKEIGVPPYGSKEDAVETHDRQKQDAEEEPDMTSTTNDELAATENLILYGPPGTGKTYATAAEAVRICLGEQVANRIRDNRSELMSAYRRLLGEGRVEFVTFHQSYSYEDFVEGLRPTTDASRLDDQTGGTSESGGFSLKVHPGILKIISERARLDTGDEDGETGERLNRKRSIFKLSLIGSDWRPALDASLEQNEIHWGFGGDIDWSHPKYDDFEEIKARWNADHPGTHPVSAAISGTWYFRAAVENDDYVMLTVGRDLIVAFGRVSGSYSYRTDGGLEAHSRPIEWLWWDPNGTDRSAIYSRKFSPFQPIYRLDDDQIDWDGLESTVLQRDAVEPSAGARNYVLIIDEINRANISKVFGELITLLEPDKRLGSQNEVRLRLPYSGASFGMPRNLHVVGTMNTADRSIALLDTALRRRFTFREMMPNPTVLKVAASACGIDLPRLLTTINSRIEYLHDREHQIGHAYFTNCASRDDLDAIMRHKVIPLLAEYFFEDWSKIAAVLGDLEAHEGPISGGFLNRSILRSPPGLEDEETQSRFRWNVRTETEGFEYTRLLTA